MSREKSLFQAPTAVSLSLRLESDPGQTGSIIPEGFRRRRVCDAALSRLAREGKERKGYLCVKGCDTERALT